MASNRRRTDGGAESKASRVSTSTTPRRAPHAAKATPMSARSAATQLFSARKSAAAPYSATRHGNRQPVDPRPIGDKGYLRASVQRLSDYLRGAGLNTACSSTRALTRPTARDFEDVCSFLFAALDPHWTKSPDRKFEDDVVDVFKTVKYPFQISKTGLCAVGTAHTWPALLAALLWLVDLVQHAKGNEAGKGDDGEAPRDDSETDERDGVASRLERAGAEGVFYEFVGDAYALFLRGDDEGCDELRRRLDLAFEVRGEALDLEFRGAEARVKDVQQRRSDAADSAQRLPATLEKRTLMRADHAAAAAEALGFEKLLNAADAEAAQSVSEAAMAQSDCDFALAKRKDVEDLRQRIVTERDEMLKLQVQKDQLCRDLEALQARRLEKADQLRQTRAAVCAALDPAAEHTLSYARRAAALLLVPRTAKNASGRDLSLGAVDEGDDVTRKHRQCAAAADRATAVKPALAEIADALRSRGVDVRAEAAQLRLEQDRAAQDAAAARDHLAHAERQLEARAQRLGAAVERSDARSEARARAAAAAAADVHAARRAAAADREEAEALHLALRSVEARLLQEAAVLSAAHLERRRSLAKSADAALSLVAHGDRAVLCLEAQVEETRGIVSSNAKQFNKTKPLETTPSKPLRDATNDIPGTTTPK